MAPHTGLPARGAYSLHVQLLPSSLCVRKCVRVYVLASLHGFTRTSSSHAVNFLDRDDPHPVSLHTAHSMLCLALQRVASPFHADHLPGGQGSVDVRVCRRERGRGDSVERLLDSMQAASPDGETFPFVLCTALPINWCA